MDVAQNFDVKIAPPLREDRWRFCVAPMLDWTDRHCRVFHRLLTRRARLYSEMVTCNALIHGNRHHLLDFSESPPNALQLGGEDPLLLGQCAKMGEDWGYSEINLNCGCPSDRVQNGHFGACLMLEPARVAAGVAAMKRAVKIPITVKCRLGVDAQEPEESLFTFAQAMHQAGADALIVHARKAWLKGLSPKANRHIPPLDYTIVRRLKALYPAWPIIINGGLTTLAAAQVLLAPAQGLPALDGVMLGRAAYENPALLLAIDQEFYGENAAYATREAALEALIPYIEAQTQQGLPAHRITRHILGMFHQCAGARMFRRILSEGSHQQDFGAERLIKALEPFPITLRG